MARRGSLTESPQSIEEKALSLEVRTYSTLRVEERSAHVGSLGFVVYVVYGTLTISIVGTRTWVFLLISKVLEYSFNEGDCVRTLGRKSWSEDMLLSWRKDIFCSLVVFGA